MVGQNCHRRQNADTETNQDRGLDAGETVARISNMPGASLRSVSSGLSALVISANPVLTAVLATWFLGERMTRRKMAGLLLGICGVAFVVESRLAGGGDQFAGIAFTIAALISLVCGTIVFKKFARATRTGREELCQPIARSSAGDFLAYDHPGRPA
jgi:drug/metabolite transporter (DMT)-like permease